VIHVCVKIVIAITFQPRGGVEMIVSKF